MGVKMNEDFKNKKNFFIPCNIILKMLLKRDFYPLILIYGGLLIRILLTVNFCPNFFLRALVKKLLFS